MSQSTHQIKLRARDETSSAFKSVETSAKMSSSRINKLIGGAVVAASSLVGAKIVSSSISRVAGTINEMARIDEAARLASTSVDDLTGAVAGLGALGLSGINMQSFAKALATMQKTTGRAGLSGFY